MLLVSGRGKHPGKEKHGFSLAAQRITQQTWESQGPNPRFPPGNTALCEGITNNYCPDCPFIIHRLSLWSGLRKHAELRDPSNYVPWTMQSLRKQIALSAFNHMFSRTVRLDGLKGCMVWHRKHLDPLICFVCFKKNAYNINGLVLPIWNALAFSFRFPTAAFLSDGAPISLKWFLGPKVSTHSGKNHSDQPPMVTRNKWWLVRDFHHNPRNIQV